MCTLYKAYNGERAWKDIGDRLQAPYYRRRVDHFWKIRTDVGKLSFVNWTITNWNRLPEGAIGTSLIKTHIFRKRARKVEFEYLDVTVLRRGIGEVHVKAGRAPAC
jgi:hypothetical protein